MKEKEMLETLIKEANAIFNSKPGKPDFDSWSYKCQRTLEKIYGNDSSELKRFNELPFCDIVGYIAGSDPYQDRRFFEKNYQEALNLFNLLLEEYSESSSDSPSETIKKVFISHSSKNVEIVEEFVDLLDTIGLKSDQIFCSSLSGYGIPLGENFIETLKEELSSDSLVIFILSQEFYESPVCMCEMGATWIQSKEHIPVLIPPFDFKDIDGTLKLTQGFIINDSLKWNEFKDKIIHMFGLEDLSDSVWERKRDRTINRINEVIKKALK